jgi:DNA mismatch repair protein MutS
MAAAPLTKVMQQHADAKRAYPDAILFFRMGDFYEMFGPDAVLAAGILKLTLTSRNKGNPDELPMAGVPYHAAHGYVGRLLQAGYQVAICEQMADPKTVRGIVPRDVVRVLTPGLVTHDDHLVAGRNNWLAALVLGPRSVAVALLDISTGELRATVSPSLASLLVDLAHEAPREILLAKTADDAEASSAEAELRAALGAALPLASLRDADVLSPEQQGVALGALRDDAAQLSAEEAEAVARVLHFAKRCSPGIELPSLAIGRWDPSSALLIDHNAERHLELVQAQSGDPRATLLAVIDDTCTAKGARLLRRRLLAPLRDVAQIRRRQDRVLVFLNHSLVREQLREHLRKVSDLDRIVSRCQLGDGTPRDLGQLRDGLLAAAAAAALLETLSDPAAREALQLSAATDVLPELAEHLRSALVERPPALAKEGEIFLAGYDAELAEFARLRTDGSELVVALEGRLREQTGINNLKVRFTRVFGWYVEVTRTALAKVPKEWRRKQTVAAGERYTLLELDELAERIAGAEEQHRARELSLLRDLVQQVSAAANRLRTLSQRLAEWDVDAALAEVAHRYDFVRPLVDEGTELLINEGRHPVVERLVAQGRFVPNDVVLDANAERLLLITGPNMAGKSTFLRQVALITILAQMGSFVPAKSAQIGLCDRILSRVGASDNLAQGQSTFMVEMQETAEILRAATPRSLVILDEIGRGTSTFDGLAIAWAVAEHLEQACRSRALFATHYHELTRLAEESPHIRNYSVSARERDGDVVFLHRLVAGAASRSYGVSVAKLAGLPEAVLARARALLALLEGDSVQETHPLLRGKGKRARSDGQMALFGAPAGQSQTPTHGAEVLDTLRAVDVERLTPLEALQLIVKLKKRL